MAAFSISVVSNQLLGHFNPEIQQNIFISCSGENYKKVNQKVMSSTERQTIGMHMVNMKKFKHST